MVAWTKRQRARRKTHISSAGGCRKGEGLVAEPGLDIEREWGSFREEGRLVGNSSGKAKTWVGEAHGASGWGRGHGV